MNIDDMIMKLKFDTHTEAEGVNLFYEEHSRNTVYSFALMCIVIA